MVEKRPAWDERQCSLERIDKEIAQTADREKQPLTNDLFDERAYLTVTGGDSNIAGKPAGRHFPALRRACLELLILCITHLDMLAC